MPRKPTFEGSALSEGQEPDSLSSAINKDVAHVIAQESNATDEMTKFVRDIIYGEWYRSDAMSKAVVNHIDVGSLTDLPLNEYALSKDPTQFGTFTLRDETPPDFENVEVQRYEIAGSQKDARLHEIMTMVLQAHKDRSDIYIPDISYFKWLREHPDKVPPQLKDGHGHYLINSLLCTDAGYWEVPYVRWGGSSRVALGRDWINHPITSTGRIILLKKNKS